LQRDIFRVVLENIRKINNHIEQRIIHIWPIFYFLHLIFLHIFVKYLFLYILHIIIYCFTYLIRRFNWDNTHVSLNTIDHGVAMFCSSPLFPISWRRMHEGGDFKTFKIRVIYHEIWWAFKTWILHTHFTWILYVLNRKHTIFV